ncbi:hypothetical protein KIPB_003319 [Kipferlia bialata]|uniref:TRAF-type domain-containing protein n=1 Tax=Kipferlia bialata TaxID=797122 RepID=A0A9K3CT84_9EUKA|nr:hypothetical protein KIPB_003319 [Kipferlia bialata]|eukprot:g3319.t1
MGRHWFRAKGWLLVVSMLGLAYSYMKLMRTRGNVMQDFVPAFQGITLDKVPTLLPGYVQPPYKNPPEAIMGLQRANSGHVLVVGAGVSTGLTYNAPGWSALLEDVNDRDYPCTAHVHGGERHRFCDISRELKRIQSQDGWWQRDKWWNEALVPLKDSLQQVEHSTRRPDCCTPVAPEGEEGDLQLVTAVVKSIKDSEMAAIHVESDVPDLAVAWREVWAKSHERSHLSAGWRQELAYQCIQVYVSPDSTTAEALLPNEGVIEYCTRYAKEAVGAAIEQLGPLHALRLLSIARIMALDVVATNTSGAELEAGHDMLSSIREALALFGSVDVREGRESEAEAVALEVRLLLDSGYDTKWIGAMPDTGNLMFTEVLWARGVMASSRNEGRRHVESVIGSLRLKLPLSFDVVSLRSGIRALQSLPHTFVSTVNYDRVLESVLDRKSVTISDTIARDSRVVGDKDVVHLHGVFTGDSSSNYALTYEEYCRGHCGFLQVLLGSPNGDTVVESEDMKRGVLRCVDGKIRPLVFIGCNGTLEDPHFLGLFERLSAAAKAGETQMHFVIGRDPSAEPGLINTVKSLNERFKGINLTFISYGKKHSNLGPFLLQQALRVAVRRDDVNVPHFYQDLAAHIHREIDSVGKWEQAALRDVVTLHSLPLDATVSAVHSALKAAGVDIMPDLLAKVKDAMARVTPNTVPQFKQSVLSQLVKGFRDLGWGYSRLADAVEKHGMASDACDHCGLYGQLGVARHTLECPRLPLPCPYCDKLIPRDQFEAHLAANGHYVCRSCSCLCCTQEELDCHRRGCQAHTDMTCLTPDKEYERMSSYTRGAVSVINRTLTLPDSLAVATGVHGWTMRLVAPSRVTVTLHPVPDTDPTPESLSMEMGRKRPRTWSQLSPVVSKDKGQQPSIECGETSYNCATVSVILDMDRGTVHWNVDGLWMDSEALSDTDLPYAFRVTSHARPRETVAPRVHCVAYSQGQTAGEDLIQAVQGLKGRPVHVYPSQGSQVGSLQDIYM